MPFTLFPVCRVHIFIFLSEFQKAHRSSLLRKRDDLIMTHSVDITEALCGFQMVFQHLDGRDIVVTHLPGEARASDDFVAFLLNLGL